MSYQPTTDYLGKTTETMTRAAQVANTASRTVEAAKDALREVHSLAQAAEREAAREREDRNAILKLADELEQMMDGSIGLPQ